MSPRQPAAREGAPGEDRLVEPVRRFLRGRPPGLAAPHPAAEQARHQGPVLQLRRGPARPCARQGRRGTGSDYPALPAERVTGPLGLTDTDCDPNRTQATGHWHDRPRPTLLMPGLTAAGAVRSSARDLLRVLTALLDPETAPGPALRTALTEVQRPRLSVPRTGSRLCLIWNLRPRPGGALLHHSGGTRGFTAFAGFLPGSGTGLVALTNTVPTPLAPFVRSAYGALRELDATPSVTVWTARV
ncbi:serine hydrolase domain-containing protein [Streptomyces sp. NPDC058378]|uniref:serine hydrolase domain-containing protein n=1 Tax=Streptomyces sp. NPDC058378 TaxID=3346469 RepID=UPI00365CFCA8